jgi:tRNA pseudouridine55 synthase
MLDGVLIIDKSEGMSSHDVVQAIRKKFNTSKVGHLGTLDPMATGVLPVSIGKATRLAQFLPNAPKEYEGEIRFGFATATYDRLGTPTTPEQTVVGDVVGDVESEMRRLTGIMDQVPPPFSAKKIGGVPAYKFARRNQSVEMSASSVEVQRFDLLAFDPPLMKFQVVCSPGTYVRSLAHDLGQRLGCGAHLTALRRTRSGEFFIRNAVGLDKLSRADVISLDQLLAFMSTIEVSGEAETRVAHGNPIRSEAAGPFARILNKKGEFIAVAFIENGWARPRLVLTSINSGRSDMLGCNLEKEIES